MDFRVHCDGHDFFFTLPRDASILSLKRLLYDAIYRDYALDIPLHEQRFSLGSVYLEDLADDILLIFILPKYRMDLILHIPILLKRPVPLSYVTNDDTLLLCDVCSYEMPYIEQWARGPYRRIEVDMDHIVGEKILCSVRCVLPSHTVLQELHVFSVYGVIPKRDQQRLRRVMNDNPRRDVMVLSVHDRITQTFL